MAIVWARPFGSRLYRSFEFALLQRRVRNSFEPISPKGESDGLQIKGLEETLSVRFDAHSQRGTESSNHLPPPLSPSLQGPADAGGQSRGCGTGLDLVRDVRKGRAGSSPVTLAILAGSRPAQPPLTAGQQIGPQLHRQPCPATPALFVQPVAHTHPMGQSDWGGRFDPTSPNPTPRLNPHRARGTDGAPPPAISCLGAFQTPAARARRGLVMPASENLHNT